MAVTTLVATGSPIQTTGYYKCEDCESKGMGLEVLLTEGDTCPSCIEHREVSWVMIR